MFVLNFKNLEMCALLYVILWIFLMQTLSLCRESFGEVLKSRLHTVETSRNETLLLNLSRCDLSSEDFEPHAT